MAVQILAGTAIGWLAAKLLIPEQPGPKPKRYAGWHPNNPPKSASAIAAATGVPEEAARPSPTPSVGNLELVIGALHDHTKPSF